MSWLLGQSFINGLLNGGIYALVSVGITIIFGVMKMVNFAMGEYVMLGMYLTWIGHSLLGWQNYSLFPFVIIGIAILAYISYKLCIRPLLGKDTTSLILVTVGLSFFLSNLVNLIFGSTPLSVSSNIKTSSLIIGEFTINYPRLIGFIVAIILLFIVNILLNKTLYGRAVRATAESQEISQILGINTGKAFAISFIVSIILAGLAGLLLTPLYYVSPTVGATFKTTALMIVVLGGLGSVKGALIGGLLVGVVEAMIGALISPDLGPAGIFIVFILVLYFKPLGMFGEGVRNS